MCLSRTMIPCNSSSPLRSGCRSEGKHRQIACSTRSKSLACHASCRREVESQASTRPYFDEQATVDVVYVNFSFLRNHQMIPVMLFGVLFAKKRYGLRDYMCVGLITAGIVTFNLSKASHASQKVQYGTCVCEHKEGYALRWNPFIFLSPYRAEFFVLVGLSGRLVSSPTYAIYSPQESTLGECCTAGTR